MTAETGGEEKKEPGVRAGPVYVPVTVLPPTIAFRTYWSRQHLWTAFYCARRAAEIERAPIDLKSEPLRRTHRAYVISAIVAAAAVLDAVANEVFLDATDNPAALKGLEAGAARRLARVWPRVERLPALSRCQCALRFARCLRFDEGAEPFQSARLLMALRNALVHARVETHDTGLPDSALRGWRVGLRGRFSTSPFAGKNAPYFPDRVLGHGAAHWSARSSIRFADRFFERLGLEPPYGSLRSDFV
jgi:hypothetical protein